MIRRMRFKFISIAMGAMVILLVTILITINLYMKSTSNHQIDIFLHEAIENEGRLTTPRNGPKAPPGEVPIIEGFSMYMTADGDLLNVIEDDGMDLEILTEYGWAAIEEGEAIGSIDDYRYNISEYGEGYLIVFADASVQNEMLERLLGLSYIIGGISLGLLFLVVVVLSKFVTKPVEMAFEKQKRFISDSSHELKTPLSIISANLDMLKMEVGDNKRIDSMKDGIKRMNGLVHELLVLARTEHDKTSFRPVELSHVMDRVILPFEVIAYEHGNRIESNIEAGVIVKGDEEDLKKMVGSLVENAIKYSRENTTIQVDLHKKGDHAVIEVFNEGIGVTKEQKEKLFEKFYRVDDSRQRETGGYGIGLSIVKNVVDKHKGKIHVESIPDEYIVFRITLRK
jgi:signal transduction histidine kinase